MIQEHWKEKKTTSTTGYKKSEKDTSWSFVLYQILSLSESLFQSIFLPVTNL